MSALLAAAIALPALLVMYLLKLRRRPLRVSSVMLWPEAATDVQVNVPLAPPRPSWLLLLHLLIGALLIMAAGRPALIGLAGSSGKLLVLVDRSASMRARDGVGEATGTVSRLDEAKQRAKEAVRRAMRAGDSTRVAVVSVAAMPQIVREFSNDLGGALAAIDEITPTDQPGDIAAALEVARAILAGAGSKEDEASAEVLLFSDGAFTDEGKELVLPGGALRLVRVGPAPTAAKQNLGIVVLSARRDENQPENVRLFARIQNASPEARVVPMRLSVDARTIETRSVTIPGLNELGPGEIGETFTLSAPSGGLAMISLGVDSTLDMLASDDAAATRLQSAAPVRALLVARGGVVRQADQVDDTLSASFLLSDVLEELRLGELKRVTRDQYEEIVRSGGLKFYDVVIFDGVMPPGAPALPSLSFGAGLPIAGLRLRQGVDSENIAARSIAGWNRQHPLLREITLDPVVVAKEMVRDAGEGGEGGGVGGGVEAIARSERGGLILVKQGQNEPKRVVVAFDLVNSNWPLQAGFPIFVKSAIDFLTAKGAESVGVQFTTTQPVGVDVRSAEGAPIFVGPMQVQSRLASAGASEISPSGERRVSLGVLDLAGVYTAKGESGAPPIAVNLLSSHESAIATSDVLRVGTRTLGTGVGGAVPREIWMWLLLTAAGLLALEWLVFARSARL